MVLAFYLQFVPDFMFHCIGFEVKDKLNREEEIANCSNQPKWTDIQKLGQKGQYKQCLNGGKSEMDWRNLDAGDIEFHSLSHSSQNYCLYWWLN